MRRVTDSFRWLLAVLVLAACAPANTPSPTPALTSTATPQPRSAQISELRNAVTARDTGGTEWDTASEGQTITVSGGVRTGDEARARVDTSEGSIVRVASNTEFELLEFPPGTENPITKLKLEAGKIWIVVTKALGSGTFEIETPTGVATVRGSLMSLEQAPNSGPLLITCLEGTCRLSNPAGNFVDLVAGQQSTLLAPGQDPSPPAPMTTVQFQDWLQEVPEALTAATTFLNAGPATPTPTPPGPPSGNLVPGALTQAQTPRLAFDNQAVLHLVYEARGARITNDYFHQQRGTNGTWTEPEALTTEFAALYGSLQLFTRPDGAACALWNGALTNDIGTSGVYQRCFIESDAPEQILPAYGTARDFRFRLAPDGQLRGVFLTSAGTLRYLPPTARVASEDSPDTPRLSDSVTAVEPQLAVDARGGLHAAWVRQSQTANDPFTLQYRYSSDDGQTWAEPQTLSTPETAPDGLALRLIADGQGNVIVLWQSADDAYYLRRWTATDGWGEVASVSRERGVTPQLAVDAAGRTRLAWPGFDGVRYAEQTADGTWSPPRLISVDPASEVALVLDAQGQAHLVWAVEGQLRYGTLP